MCSQVWCPMEFVPCNSGGASFIKGVAKANSGGPSMDHDRKSVYNSNLT